LGSCLGIKMYDPVTGASGLLHAVLPQCNNGSEPGNPKYVDSGIEGLLSALLKKGADRRRIIIKMAGGANMLITPGFKHTFDIGNRNVESAHKTFERLNLSLKKEDVGGNIGRTVRVYVASGRMTVRIIGGTEQEL
jgi:chemotaxis protein CheD